MAELMISVIPLVSFEFEFVLNVPEVMLYETCLPILGPVAVAELEAVQI